MTARPVEQAAAREMLKETDWRAGELHPLMTVESSDGLSDALHHLYRADNAEHV